MHPPYAAANLDAMQHAKAYAAAICRLVRTHLGHGHTGDVLDFGAGTGAYALALEGLVGRRVVAVEPDTRLHAQYPNELRRVSTLGELRVGNAAAAYSLNVFEHIEDDAGALRELAAWLRPGAPVFLLVPAGMELWTPMDDLVGHCRRYTPQSLRALGERAGLNWRTGGWFDRTGYAATRLLQLKNHFGSRRAGWDGKLNPTHVKLFDQGFRFAEPVLAGLSLPFGKNCWAVFEVPASAAPRAMLCAFHPGARACQR